MRLPLDLLARLKAARHQGRQTQSSRLLRQWVFILCIGLALMVIASVYAAWRFEYWSQIEENVANEELGNDFYDRSSIERILREFDDRASTTRALLSEAEPAAVATTTETAE